MTLCSQTGGYFQYIDGWHISSPNWGRREPSTIGPCVYIDVDGTWKTATCSENKTSVCMKSKGEAHEIVGYLHYRRIKYTIRYSSHTGSENVFGHCVLFYSQMWHQQSQVISREFALMTQKHEVTDTDCSRVCGSHLRATVMSLLQTWFHGHLHPLTVYNMVSICVCVLLIIHMWFTLTNNTDF